jgi:hypothetical protein
MQPCAVLFNLLGYAVDKKRVRLSVGWAPSGTCQTFYDF